MPIELGGLSRAEFAAIVSHFNFGKVMAADLPQLLLLNSEISGRLSFLEGTEKRSVEYQQRQLQATIRGLLGKLDTPTLKRLALGDGKKQPGDWRYYDYYCHRWIEEEVARIVDGKKLVVSFPADAPPLPEELKWLSQRELPNSETKRFIGPFGSLLAKLGKQKPRGLYRDNRDYGAAADAFLRDGRKGTAEEVLRFHWDSTCGTGAEEFYDGRATLACMSLLRDRRLTEAVGASFLVPDAPVWMREPNQPFDTWRIDLLKHCGVDWERALPLAAHLDFFAANGSEVAARHFLAQVKTEVEPFLRQLALEDLSAFLAPQETMEENRGDPRAKLPAALQKEIVDLLAASVGGDASFRVIEQRIALFEKLRRPETRETLHALVKNPSTTVAERAAQVLRSMGDDIPAILPAPPVRFRMFLNGKPWAAQELNYILRGGRPGAVGSGYIKTDAEGFTEIPRDVFLDPEKSGKEISFGHLPNAGFNPMSDERQYDESWVEVSLGAPMQFDDFTRVDFATCPLSVEIEYVTPPAPVRRERTTFRLMREKKTDPNDWSFYIQFQDRMSPPKQFTLSALQPGSYRLFAVVPGAARWESDVVEVKPGMAPLRVKLEKGSHIYANIAIPENARGIGERRLFRGTVDVTALYARSSIEASDEALFAGVPKGHYRLRVLSTAEVMQQHGIKEWPAPDSLRAGDMRRDVDCEGLDAEFTIDDESPPMLSLGRLEIQPVAAMREKVRRWRDLTNKPPGAEPPAP